MGSTTDTISRVRNHLNTELNPSQAHITMDIRENHEDENETLLPHKTSTKSSLKDELKDNKSIYKGNDTKKLINENNESIPCACDEANTPSSKIPKTTYVPAATVIFWLSMWFVLNIGVTFWNKKALSAIRLPVTLTFVHMICNTIGAFTYIYIYRGIERTKLKDGQKTLMIGFSLIFVSNIITGNWSLGIVSITFNQIMRALIPGITVGLSMLLLGKVYTMERKISLIPVALGVYLVCSGDNSSTFWGFIVTFAACILAALKVVLSNKFLSGDLKLHPVDLILHQAPLSAIWCLITMFTTGEIEVLRDHWEEIPELCPWFLITGVISFLLNITSFYSNKVTSAVTLCVCGNVKQVMVIILAIVVQGDLLTTQKLIGFIFVCTGSSVYAYISNREMNEASAIRPQSKEKIIKQ